MGSFLEAEKMRQITLKNRLKYFSALDSGMYRDKVREFCLPVKIAEENIYVGIRNAAINYFKDKSIKWHQGHNDGPVSLTLDRAYYFMLGGIAGLLRFIFLY